LRCAEFPQAGLYIQQLTWRLPDRAPTELVRRAWEIVASRYDALRLFFHAGAEGDLHQFAANSVPVRVNSMTGGPADLENFLAEERRKGFDLEKPPLWRVTIFQQPGESVCIWTFHHLLLDGRSHTHVFLDWQSVFQSLQTDAQAAVELPARPQFAEFLAWRTAGPSPRAEEYWRERLRAEPEAWCAHEWVALATTPVCDNGNIVPRLFHMRSLVVAQGGGYHAMPGGLTRVPMQDDDLTISMQSGGRSKDTWVLLPPELPPPAEISAVGAVPIKLRRPAADLPSRVADNFFWLGRYLERAEGQAHLLRLIAGTLAEEGAAADPDALRPFFETLRLAGSSHLLANGKVPTLDLAAAEQDLRELLWAAEQPSSLAANIARVERTAYRVKERLPADVWNLFGHLRQTRGAPEDPAAFLQEAFAGLQDALAHLAAISGFMMDSMIRGYGWRFLDLGRRIERGLNMAELLRRTLGRFGPPSPALLHNLLVSCECLLIYRRRYLTNLQVVPVLDLLTCDDTNPHGLAFQLRRAQQHVAELPREADADAAGRPVDRLARALANQASLADAHRLAQENDFGAHPAFLDFLNTVTYDLAALSDALGLEYFAHSGPEVKS